MDPAWSPYGSQILFRQWFSPGGADIFVTYPDGSGQTNLSNSSDFEWAAVWSPDATHISFPSDGDIYVMNRDGSRRTNLTSSAEFDHGPAWYAPTDR